MAGRRGGRAKGLSSRGLRRGGRAKTDRLGLENRATPLLGGLLALE